MDLLHGFVKTSNFYDDANFPQGFSRSGHFTLQEADLLTAIGKRLFQLEHKLDTPNNQTEENFLHMCENQREPETRVERLWQKYKSVTQGKRFHTLSSTVKTKVEDSYSDIEGDY